MAYIKPGKVIGGFTWTGKRWVKTPERTSEKVALRKEIEKVTVSTTKSGQASQMSTAKASYPGGSPRMSKSSPMVSGKKSAEGPKRSTGKPTAAQIAAAKKTADKPAPATNPTPSKTPTAGKASTSSSTQKKTAAPKGKAVSQSNTMWVKKGDTVGGKTVEKGYLAQYGKPEKKVTANVKLVVDTARGKAGSKVSYNKGKATKKGK